MMKIEQKYNFPSQEPKGCSKTHPFSFLFILFYQFFSEHRNISETIELNNPVIFMNGKYLQSTYFDLTCELKYYDVTGAHQ